MSTAKVLPQFVAGTAAAFGAFCLGSSIGWSSPVEIDITNGYFGFSVNTDEFSWIGSLLTLGATCVCIPIGFLISLIGRKPSMLILVPPYLVGWLLILIAQNVFMLYVGRFLLGVCGGAFCITAPMYTTEIAQVERRGIIGSFFQLLIVNGVLYSYIVGHFVSVDLLTILCGILPIIFFAVFIFMPESPVYLIQKDKMEAAQKSMAWLRGKDYDASAELAQMQALTKKTDEKINIGAALRRKVTLKGLFISIALMLFQQFTGINAIVFYSTSIFVEAGTGFSASMCTIITGILNVLLTFISLALIDRTGRRILLCLSALFMGIATGLMGLYFFLKEGDPNSVKSLAWLPVISTCIFIVFFSIGFGPVPWLLMAEIFSEDIKGVAGSISGTTNWACAFLVTKLFPILKTAIGPALTFWIFTIIANIALAFVIIFVPETKGKTLQQIQDILSGLKT